MTNKENDKQLEKIVSTETIADFSDRIKEKVERAQSNFKYEARKGLKYSVALAGLSAIGYAIVQYVCNNVSK